MPLRAAFAFGEELGEPVITQLLPLVCRGAARFRLVTTSWSCTKIAIRTGSARMTSAIITRFDSQSTFR